LNIAWFDIDFPFFFFFFFLFFVYASVLLCVCVKVILFFPSTWLLSIRKRMNGIVFFFFYSFLFGFVVRVWTFSVFFGVLS
jgi:hypothetical protein